MGLVQLLKMLRFHFSFTLKVIQTVQLFGVCIKKQSCDYAYSILLSLFKDVGISNISMTMRDYAIVNYL